MNRIRINFDIGNSILQYDVGSFGWGYKAQLSDIVSKSCFIVSGSLTSTASSPHIGPDGEISHVDIYQKGVGFKTIDHWNSGYDVIPIVLPADEEVILQVGDTKRVTLTGHPDTNAIISAQTIPEKYSIGMKSTQEIQAYVVLTSSTAAANHLY